MDSELGGCASGTVNDSASLPCEACSLDPKRCIFCQLPYAGKAECRVRAAQHTAIEEIAAQRAMAAEDQRRAREKELLRQYRNTLVDSQRKTGDEMRGGLHVLESKGFIGQAQSGGLEASRTFSRLEAVSALKALAAHYKGTTLPPEVILGHAIRMFQEME